MNYEKYILLYYTFLPAGIAIPLPVDPREEASEEPMEDDNEAVLLALLC